MPETKTAGTHTVTERHGIRAIGYLSAELAYRADAWKGNAPPWFPEPPEWLELWQQALEATVEDEDA